MQEKVKAIQCNLRFILQIAKRANPHLKVRVCPFILLNRKSCRCKMLLPILFRQLLLDTRMVFFVQRFHCRDFNRTSYISLYNTIYNVFTHQTNTIYCIYSFASLYKSHGSLGFYFGLMWLILQTSHISFSYFV